ncbi:Acyl dehydratase [Salinibacillus kushneri]|uniref:Acyl dehydratase n=1 Tax=Salinibacillus kushneri TaxID=237682 RepID=A0A1I0H8H9_9BACI|nr:MaoC/PaaZ C-terminal domain-containing protein [Salinibacillus kushneri]SET79169.1 Acyl dehydratase [Salinibacillus kushneri]
MLFKKRKLGRLIHDLQIGEQYEKKVKIYDKDLLLYLGLTDDSNPLYIQHDYASQTPYKRPLVPSVMLYGFISTIVTTHLPGPGSHITGNQLSYPKPVYHDDEIHLKLEIIKIDESNHRVSLQVYATDSVEDIVIEGEMEVCPPYQAESIISRSLENFH